MRHIVWVIVSIAATTLCQARTIYVDANHTGDYPTIQDAVNDANHSDMIILQPGIYKGIGNRDIDFLGKAITVQSTNPNDPSVIATTIIDCEGSYQIPFRAFYFHNNEGPNSVVAGLTIIHGYFYKPTPIGPGYPIRNGHAILCDNASPAIVNCSITACGMQGPLDNSNPPTTTIFNRSNAKIIGCEILDNKSYALTAFDSNLQINECVISGNWTGIKLGDLSSDFGCTVDLTNCEILRNKLGIQAFTSDMNITGSEINGNMGGIEARDCNLILTNCEIRNNKSIFPSNTYDTPAGGGIALAGGNALLERCLISDNVAYHGGGIYCYYGKIDIRDCDIVNNTAGSLRYTNFIGRGGGISSQYATLTISNSRIKRNECAKKTSSTAATAGGGIYYYSDAYNDAAEIRDCEITNNIADQGGGIYIQGDTYVANSVVADNTGPDSGAGLYQNYGNSKIVNCTFAGNSQGVNRAPVVIAGSSIITNCIIWDKLGEYSISEGYGGGTFTISYSNVRGGIGFGPHNISKDPLFALEGDYRLKAGSPCIDSGTNDPCLPMKDIDGNPRPVDGNGDGSILTDIGAYEFDPNRIELAASPRYISFTYDALENPQTKKLNIRCTTEQTINWQITGGAEWLQVSPKSGTATTDIAEIFLTADGNGMATGTYECRLEITDFESRITPITIVVILHIGRVISVPGGSYYIWNAIDDANNYDVVQIADGNYYGYNNYDFRGKKIIVRSQNGPENCIIDFHSSYHGFYFHSGETGETVLKGLTITGGRGLESDYYDYTGGGIACIASSPTITQCRLERNFADYGGGIYCRLSSSIISQCDINENYGGGIACYDSDAKILNCRISRNKTAGFSGFGSGIVLIGGETLASDCQITDNNSNDFTGSGLAGGVFVTSGTIFNSLIKGNTAYEGGAGHVEYNGKILNCMILDNNSQIGGAFACEAGAKFENCLIAGNKASSKGGVFYIAPVMTGGPYPPSTPIVIRNCTISDNSIPTNGFALQFAKPPWFGPAPKILITNSIFRNGGHELSGQVDVNYSNIEGGWPGIGNIDANLCFISETDYHLILESPCVDAGDPNYKAGKDETDLDGNPRIVYGRIDMGAYEYQNNAPVADAGPNQIAYAWIDGIVEVTLDGSDSYDLDGDELSYLWTCSINGNPWETNNVNPTIELPVGEYAFELVVNDGTEDSEPNYVDINVVGPVKGLLMISPQVINRQCNQKRIIAMLRLPDGITKDQIDGSQKLSLYPGGIEAVNQFIMPYYANGAKRWFIFAFFDRNEVLESIGGSGFVKVYAVGQLKTGRYFYGSSTIVISNHGRRPKWGNMRDWFHNYHHSHFRRPNK